MEEKKFINEKLGMEIRTLMIEGEPYFVGKDVASILGYKEPRSAVSKKVDEEDRGVSKIATPSGTQEMTVINESGLYSLIFSSKLPSAKKFKRWVTSEVLPQLRKTGAVILDHAEEEAIDYEKKFGAYRIRKTFNNSNDLKADYEQFKKLSIKEQKAKRINAAEKIKRTNIIFDTIQKRLNNNLATLKGSEMLAMQELLTDIKSDVLVVSNRKNGQEKRNIKKIASKYFAR